MATNYQFIGPGAALPGVSATGTVQLNRLGLIAGAVDASQGYAEFMYVQGASASTPTAGDMVILSQYSAGQAGTGRTGSQGMCGVVPAALSATNVFGWVQVMGFCDYAKGSNTSFAAGLPVVMGSTLGQVLKSSATNDTGNRVDGAYFLANSATTASNSVSVFLYYPVYNGR